MVGFVISDIATLVALLVRGPVYRWLSAQAMMATPFPDERRRIPSYRSEEAIAHTVELAAQRLGDEPAPGPLSTTSEARQLALEERGREATQIVEVARLRPLKRGDSTTRTFDRSGELERAVGAFTRHRARCCSSMGMLST